MRLGVSRRQLSDVLNGKSGISPEMAVRLEKAFGQSAAEWCLLQADYDAARAIEKSNGIKIDRLWHGKSAAEQEAEAAAVATAAAGGR